MAEQIEQTTTLLQNIAVKPTTAIVDLGFRGREASEVPVAHSCGKYKTLSAIQLKRCQAIEPAIGHTKHDNGMDRCWLKGQDGDALHAVPQRALTSAGCCGRSSVWGCRAFSLP